MSYFASTIMNSCLEYNAHVIFDSISFYFSQKHCIYFVDFWWIINIWQNSSWLIRLLMLLRTYSSLITTMKFKFPCGTWCIAHIEDGWYHLKKPSNTSTYSTKSFKGNDLGNWHSQIKNIILTISNTPKHDITTLSQQNDLYRQPNN